MALSNPSGSQSQKKNSAAPTLESSAARTSGNTRNKRDLHGASLMETISGGWLITAVVDGSRADRKGLRVGDRIVAIDGKSIRTVSDFGSTIDRITNVSSGLGIERDGQRFNVIL